jgi:YebC/PmpR family DNA-binding regulatory protein
LARGRLFSKLSRAITIAAREGADPEKNFALRLAIDQARGLNMPKANIERAIKRASGVEKEGRLEEALYEGYGPGAVAFMVKVVTDNRQRTAAEIKNIFERSGGGLAGRGSVSFMFASRGVITVSCGSANPEEIMLSSIDAGALDVDKVGTSVLVYTKPEELDEVKKNLVGQGLIVENAELGFEPERTIKISDSVLAKKILGLADKLDEAEDAQRVFANFDIPEEILRKVSEEGG